VPPPASALPEFGLTLAKTGRRPGCRLAILIPELLQGIPVDVSRETFPPIQPVLAVHASGGVFPLFSAFPGSRGRGPAGPTMMFHVKHHASGLFVDIAGGSAHHWRGTGGHSRSQTVT